MLKSMQKQIHCTRKRCEKLIVCPFEIGKLNPENRFGAIESRRYKLLAVNANAQQDNLETYRNTAETAKAKAEP